MTIIVLLIHGLNHSFRNQICNFSLFIHLFYIYIFFTFVLLLRYYVQFLFIYLICFVSKWNWSYIKLLCLSVIHLFTTLIWNLEYDMFVLAKSICVKGGAERIIFQLGIFFFSANKNIFLMRGNIFLQEASVNMKTVLWNLNICLFVLILINFDEIVFNLSNNQKIYQLCSICCLS